MDARPTPPAADPVAGGPAPLPGSRAGDAALASGVFLIALLEVVGAVVAPVATPLGTLSGSAGIAVGIVLAGAQAGVVMLRRQRPRSAYAVLAAVAVLMFATIGGFATYTWPVLAFAVARAPGRAAGWLAGPLLGALAAVALLGTGAPADLQTRIGLGVGLGLSMSVLVLIGAAAGRYTRYGARRADEQRRETERVRRAAALRDERARIAEEIGSGVLAGLRRLVEQTRDLAPDRPGGEAGPELRRLHERARSVLAAMRRVLGVLRAPVADDSPGGDSPDGGSPHGSPSDRAPHGGGPGPGPAAGTGTGSGGRRSPPLPDQAGLVVLAALLVVALPLAALPRVRTGEVRVDRVIDALELPLGSPVALLAVAVQFAAVAWWRTAPVPAVVVAGVCSLLAATAGSANLFADCGWLLLVWGAASRAPARWSGPAVLVSTLAVLAGQLASGAWTGPVDRLALTLGYLWMVPFWVAGALVRRQRRAADRGRRERADAGDRDAVARERLRVARDLHDVVAHHVSAIAVQAGAARMAADPDARATALTHIAESGRRVAEALPALDGLTPDPHGVVLDGDGVDRLLAPARDAGLPVTADVAGSPPAHNGDAELFAQRILTEALTNVLRHAGPARTRVRVEHEPPRVSVEVADDGPVPGHRPDGTGSGLGLVGMRERIALLGGELHAGPDGPGWAVRAVLPRAGLVREDEPAAVPISSPAPTRRSPRGS